MSVYTISPGVITNMLVGVVYALPVSRCLLAKGGAGTLEMSMDGTTFAAVTLTNNQMEAAGGFLRTTGSASSVVCKN